MGIQAIQDLPHRLRIFNARLLGEPLSNDAQQTRPLIHANLLQRLLR